jgi:hypothetical protein
MTLTSPAQNPIKPLVKPLVKPLLAGGLLFTLILIVLDMSGSKSLLNNPAVFASATNERQAIESLGKDCNSEPNEQASLSRQQLLELLTVPERDSKTKVREIVKEPYCQLSSLQVRAGVDAVREAYPLSFDSKTTLVILYENNEYAGYRFKH